MKVGDLIRVSVTADLLGTIGEIGIITWVWENEHDVVVHFSDGPYQMDPDDLEVISESR